MGAYNVYLNMTEEMMLVKYQKKGESVTQALKRLVHEHLEELKK